MISPPEIQMAATAALRKMGADIEPGKVLTFDGNLSGREFFDMGDGLYMVKISDEYYDLNTLESYTVYRRDKDGTVTTTTLKKGEFEVENTGDMQIIGQIIASLKSDMDDGTSAMSKGTYVTLAEQYGLNYISMLEFSETIHPIDDKFLPGVCLPLVELTTEATAEGTKLTAEENERMNKAAAQGVPIIVDFNFKGIRYAMPFVILKLETAPQYSALFGGVLGWNLACNTANEWTFLIMTTDE